VPIYEIFGLKDHQPRQFKRGISKKAGYIYPFSWIIPILKKDINRLRKHVLRLREIKIVNLMCKLASYLNFEGTMKIEVVAQPRRAI
jgi:hypothetical protein